MKIYSILLVAFVLAFCGFDFALAKAAERKQLAWQWPLHGALYFCGQLAGLVVPISALTAATLGASVHFDIGRWIEQISWPLALIAWGLVSTLQTYGLHYAEHRYKPLWSFHRIHHCDERMDSSTAFRHHPAEDIIAILAVVPFAFLMTPSASVLLSWYAISVAVDLFNHSRLQLADAVSELLEWLIVTPRMHRVHHSPLARQTDSNYGGTFTFWDRIFGTYRKEVPAGQGLDDERLRGKNSRDFDVLIFEPFRFAWSAIVHRR